VLYYLFYEKLYPHFSPFRVFRYLTFRTAFASITALAICIFLGPWLITRLREFQIGQFIREEGPTSHKTKAGTPTMGGILINVAILLPTLLWADLSSPLVWVVIVATLGFAVVGFLDDYAKVRKRHNRGLTGRNKLYLQALISFAVGISLLLLTAKGGYSTRLIVPFTKSFSPDLLIHSFMNSPYTYPFGFLFFFVFVIFVIVGSSNAVNLTDGLDGLAAGCSIVAAGALTILTYVTGHAVFARYLELNYIPQVGEVTVFCGSMVGACLGFLWYNAYPAQIFMGDVGSLSLGGAIGTVAVVIKQEILLLFIGGVFVAEALSVILQVASFKMTGKRIFAMAPLHHHFELKGWTESKVIIRFWVVSLILALFALSTLKLR